MSAPLVLIHGYPFDHTLWDFVSEPLRRNISVIAPDLSGFGGKPVLKEAPSIDLLADEIAALLKSKKIEKAVVAGMSMGGYVALALAERHPNLVAGLGLISTQAGADTDEARKGRRDLITKVQAEGPQAALKVALPKLFAPANADNESFKKFPIQGAEKAGVAGICWALEAMARRPDRTAVLKSLRVPALVLHGTEDMFIPVERARQTADLIAGVDFVAVPDAGHVLPLESPSTVVESLRHLMERL
jgi:pimeloyl-ACP methyl ester carboxylesterase